VRRRADRRDAHRSDAARGSAASSGSSTTIRAKRRRPGSGSFRGGGGSGGVEWQRRVKRRAHRREHAQQRGEQRNEGLRGEGRYPARVKRGDGQEGVRGRRGGRLASRWAWARARSCLRSGPLTSRDAAPASAAAHAGDSRGGQGGRLGFFCGPPESRGCDRWLTRRRCGHRARGRSPRAKSPPLPVQDAPRCVQHAPGARNALPGACKAI
jgi:hypothetical protein